MNTPMTDAVMKAAFQGDGAALVQRQAEALFHHARRLESALQVAENALKAARADLCQAHEAIGKQFTDEALLYTGGGEAAADKALRVIEQLKGE